MLRRIKIFSHIDWLLLGATLPIIGAGLLTMKSFVGEGSHFDKQLVWVSISLGVFFIFSLVDWRFLKRTNVIVYLFLVSCALLVTILVIDNAVKGGSRWLELGFISFQPSDAVKLVLIILLAKYFSRRHVEIANFRHLFVSGFYAGVLFLLVFFQPDLGSAIIFFCIWLGMVLVSGISKKHLFFVFVAGAVAFVVLWFNILHDYQKHRVINFVNPLADIQGTGYNAYQSMIAVGSGELWGKGVGYGTQSRLKFLPEFQTDFIFAAFAEEWGFMGVSVILFFYGIILWRILKNAIQGATNFEVLFCLGTATLIVSHAIINIGMNIGILPVTGITLPFMSYGGTHILVEFSCLGIIMGMRKYRLPAPKEFAKNEIVGVDLPA